jgi:hypothetical protein
VKDDNVDLAEAIFDAHHDEMTFKQRNRVLDALREPMQRREDDAIFEAAAGGLTKAPAAQQAGQGHDTYQQPVMGGHISNSFAQHKSADQPVWILPRLWGRQSIRLLAELSRR